MQLHTLAAVALVTLAAACGPNPHQKVDPHAPVDISGGSHCPDDGPRLPGTGICHSQARAWLDTASEPAASEGCVWTVNETMLPDGDALLYRARTCNGGPVTKLAFAGGAHSASITYDLAAMANDPNAGREVIKLFGTDPDPQGALKAAIAALPQAERADCEIHPAGIESWPADALVIAPTAAARARMKADGPISACGPLGLDEGSMRYWRIGHGFAWFFDLGQEAPAFDPATITVITKGDDGGWAVKS